MDEDRDALEAAGHIALFEDATQLAEDVKAYDFHDFCSLKNEPPKIELIKRLDEMKERVLAGAYDN